MNIDGYQDEDESLFCREDVYGRHYYKDIWEKIEDNHFPECPVSVSASQKRISTCCMCPEIRAANLSADECLRCHNLVEACRCGAKAQLV